MYTHARIYLCECTCACTRQAFESELQDEDADWTDDESEPCRGLAEQDQRGDTPFVGKVACLMWCDTLFVSLCTSHVTLTNVKTPVLWHTDE